MDRNIFICYARKDLDIIKAFLYDLNEEAGNYPFKVNALIDKSRKVLGTGDRSKEKLQEHIRKSDGAVIFISNRFVDSDFINKYEIPAILEKKQNDPDFVITPIFIDKPSGVSKEILEFQSPNTEEQEIRKLDPSLRELIYKKYTKEIYEYFMDFYKKESEEGAEGEGSEETGEESDQDESSEKSGFRSKIGVIFTIVILGIFYNIFSDPIQKSCSVIADYIYTQADNENAYIEIHDKAVVSWNEFIEEEFSEEYNLLTSEEQKDLHQQLGVYEFNNYKNQIDDISNKIATLGFDNIHEDHIEIKKLVLLSMDKQIQILDLEKNLLYKYSEYIDEIENYFEIWDLAYENEAEQLIKELDNNFIEYRSQNIDDVNTLYELIDAAEKDHLNTINEFITLGQEACPLEFSENS